MPSISLYDVLPTKEENEAPKTSFSIKTFTLCHLRTCMPLVISWMERWERIWPVEICRCFLVKLQGWQVLEDIKQTHILNTKIGPTGVKIRRIWRWKIFWKKTRNYWTWQDSFILQGDYNPHHKQRQRAGRSNSRAFKIVFTSLKTMMNRLIKENLWWRLTFWMTTGSLSRSLRLDLFGRWRFINTTCILMIIICMLSFCTHSLVSLLSWFF